MHIHRYGTGSRIFFGLHGWSGTHQTFAPLAAHLPDDASLFAVDLPACGRSPRPADWTLEAFAETLADAMRALSGERFTMIGNCSGALLGLLAAPLVQERIERCVLIDPFAYTPWYFKLFLVPMFGKLAYYSSFANPLGRWITNLSLAKHRQNESDLTEGFDGVDHEAALRYLKLFDDIGSIERFRRLQVPTDILLRRAFVRRDQSFSGNVEAPLAARAYASIERRASADSGSNQGDEPNIFDDRKMLHAREQSTTADFCRRGMETQSILSNS